MKSEYKKNIHDTNEKITQILQLLEEVKRENEVIKQDIRNYEFKINEILKNSYRQSVFVQEISETLGELLCLKEYLYATENKIIMQMQESNYKLEESIENIIVNNKTTSSAIKKELLGYFFAREQVLKQKFGNYTSGMEELIKKEGEKRESADLRLYGLIDINNKNVNRLRDEQRKLFQEEVGQIIKEIKEERGKREKKESRLYELIYKNNENFDKIINEQNEIAQKRINQIIGQIKEEELRRESEDGRLIELIENNCEKTLKIELGLKNFIHNSEKQILENAKLENNKKKLEIEKTKKIINERELYVISIWNLEGATDKLINYLEEWMFSKAGITSKAILIYLCCLLERGKREWALVGLRKYFKEYGENDILDFLPLANLASYAGMGTDKVKKAGYIFERLERERKEEGFSKYLSNGEFVFVGNSPSISNMGKSIDAKSIVFRMNTYQLSEEYVKDTGRKITAFIDNSNFATINHPNHINAGKLEWIYIPYDFWHIGISQFCNADLFIDSYYRLLTEEKVKVAYLEPEHSIELKRELKIISPSSGMAIFWTIYKMFGYVRREWFVGYTEEHQQDGIKENHLKDKGDKEHPLVQRANLDAYFDRDEMSTYYKNAPIYSKGQGHNYNKELDLREKIFNRS